MKKHKKSADGTKIYTPGNIIPRDDTLIITDNITVKGGRVYNTSEENAEEARDRVDDIRL